MNDFKKLRELLTTLVCTDDETLVEYSDAGVWVTDYALESVFGLLGVSDLANTDPKAHSDLLESAPTNTDPIEEPKAYKLESMGDLLSIPKDRFDDFLVDLKSWHDISKDTQDMLSAVAKDVGEETPIVITMRWIDDGEHDKKIIIKTAPPKAELNNHKGEK